MNIVISKTSPNTQQSVLQQRFDKLVREIKNKQNRNEKLKRDLVELYQTYQRDVLPVEKLLMKPYSELAERLIDFFGRKSLTKWQREELGQWIMECIEKVDSMDSEASESLFQLYRQRIADFLEVDLEEMEKQSQQFEASLEDIFESNDDGFTKSDSPDPSKQKGYQEDLFGFDDVESDDDVESQKIFEDLFEDFFEEANIRKNQKNNKVLDDKWIKSLFRRAANALHPDKESEPAKKLEKEVLMSKLLVARDKGDVFSLINIYMQYVDSDDMQISEETMSDLCDQLRHQKNHLEEEKFEIINENPVYALIYDNFFSTSKKTQKKKIETHLKQVNVSISNLNDLTENMRNLKILKSYLEIRYDEFRFSHISHSAFEEYY